MGMQISKIKDLAADSTDLTLASVALIQGAIEMGGHVDDQEVEWQTVHAMYCLVGEHRVKIDAVLHMLPGNPEQAAQNFLQDLARKMMQS